MNIKTILTAILFTLSGCLAVHAQESLKIDAQITSENALVSGKPYLLYYVGSNQSCYVKANNDWEYFKVVYSDNTITDEAIFCFNSSADNTWKIQSWKTGKFFPLPANETSGSYNQTIFQPVDESSAGLWVLNFQSNNTIAPSCANNTNNKDYSLNRSLVGGVCFLHGWTKGTAGANQLIIYEIALSTTANATFANKEINISGTAAAAGDLTTDKWYVMKAKSGDNDFFVDDATGYTSSTSPVTSATNSAKYLVQLTAGDNGNYYVETGLGNYLFANGSSYITTRVSAQQYSASDLATDWDLYPVALEDPFSPLDSKYYQIKTDDNTGDGQNWIFSPTGYGTNQYYLYNTSSQKFAYPTESGSWTLKPSAVPVILERQIDGHYIITTKDGTTPFRIGDETLMNIIEVGDTTSLSPPANLNTALQKLIGAYTQITAPSQIRDGWYAIRIKSDSNNPLYDGNFLYTLPTPYDAGGTLYYPYPVGHGGLYNQHPAKDSTTYYFRLWPVERTVGGVTTTYYHWQMPNGIYVVNYKNNFPIRYHQDLSDFIIGQNADGTFYIQSSNFRVQAADEYVGKTARKFMESTTKLEILRKDLSDAGLTAWRVVFNDGADDVPLHCTRGDINGANVAYNGGYFMLPENVTPALASNDFDTSDAGFVGDAEVRTSDNTIRVVYAPATCFTESDITVVQGSRTTGKGNTMQPLLRIKVVPQAPCYPESFTLSTLTGYNQLDNVKAWLTHSEQLHAEGADPVLLATQSTLSGSNVILTVPSADIMTSSHLMRKGEDTYLWITADIKSDAFESNSIDAAISQITYKNEATTNTPCSITTKGNPDGEMRIFLHQQYVRVSTETAGIESYYRNPAILRDGSNLLAFCDYRYDNVLGLGKDYDNADYGHRIDVLMFKSTDNGASWATTPTTVAAGSDGDATNEPSGFAGPAVARTSNGKLICLMAMGRRSYESATLQHIGYTYSSNGGSTWSSPTDIWSSINWNSLNPTSAYVTPGKGVTFSNGRVAFVLNAKLSALGNTNEYVLYSDDEGSSWNVVPTTVFGNGKYGKLEVMNDQRLLTTVSRGADTYLDGCGYNTTTGDASADGITDWNTSSNWSSSLNSYGCINDILYFGRSPEAAGIHDAVLHSVVKDYSDQRYKNLKLYTSFDQAASWKEMFTVTPANAATSSMQKTSDGDLAVFFEDGSIGNNEKDSCYALNCVVISKEMIEAKQTDLYTAKVISAEMTGDFATFSELVSGGWYKKVTTKSSDTSIAGVEITADYDAFNKENAPGSLSPQTRVFDIQPSASASSNTITITAPDGYIIKSYSITGYNKNSAETYTLTAADGQTTATFNGGSTSQATLSYDNIYNKTTSFTFANSGTYSYKTNYANITDFRIELAKEYSVELHQVNTGGSGDQKSYATLYVPFDLIQTDNKTKAYYVSEAVAGGTARLLPTRNNGREIPYRTAVVLINSDGATHVSFAVASGLQQIVSEEANKLKGTLEVKNLNLTQETNNNYYTLGRRRYNQAEQGQSADWTPWVAGFYKTNTVLQLAANRAYLETTVPGDPSGSRVGFDISLDDEGGEPTSISQINDGELKMEHSAAAGWYTLDGRKINTVPNAKGVYIMNGRKVVIK